MRNLTNQIHSGIADKRINQCFTTFRHRHKGVKKKNKLINDLLNIILTVLIGHEQ